MTALPRAIAALWGIEESGRRGPKRTLSVVGIGEAAVRIADTEGLPAVSMSSVARELGTTAMALYRYVDSRQELEAVMVDVATGPPPESDPKASWRQQLFDWAWGGAQGLGGHPGGVGGRPGPPPGGPHPVAWARPGMQGGLPAGVGEQGAAT